MKTNPNSIMYKDMPKVLVKALLVLLLLVGQSALAEEIAPQADSQQNKSQLAADYKKRIELILEQKEFNNKKTVTAWRLKDLKDKEKREAFPEWIIKIIEFFERNRDTLLGISRVIEFILWVVFVAVFIYLPYRYRESIAELVKRIKRKPAKVKLPSKMFGLDVRKDSLPKDIVRQAQQDWAVGNERAALSLLFRAALSKLLHEYDCQFRDGDTETECCNEVAKLQNKGLTKFMQNLTVIWQQLAYAHIKPTKTIFNQLCKQWSGVF